MLTWFVGSDLASHQMWLLCLQPQLACAGWWRAWEKEPCDCQHSSTHLQGQVALHRDSLCTFGLGENLEQHMTKHSQNLLFSLIMSLDFMCPGTYSSKQLEQEPLSKSKDQINLKALPERAWVWQRSPGVVKNVTVWEDDFHHIMSASCYLKEGFTWKKIHYFLSPGSLVPNGLYSGSIGVFSTPPIDAS